MRFSIGTEASLYSGMPLLSFIACIEKALYIIMNSRQSLLLVCPNDVKDMKALLLIVLLI